MKRFISTILGVSLFFIGVGAIVEKAGAKFKSDEKALALIRAARAAIGGDSAISEIQSLRIVGQTTQTFKVDGTDRTEQGETEIALQMPDKLMKMVRFANQNPDGAEKEMIKRQVEVVVTGKDADGKTVFKGEGQGSGTGTGIQKFVIKKGDLPQEIETTDGKIIVRRSEAGDNVEWKTEGGDNRNITLRRLAEEARHGEMRQNELFRLTLGLLLSAPQGMDVNYTLGGESDVDGTPCNLVVAEFGGASIKLFLNRDSNLPVMMAYTAVSEPNVVQFTKEVPAPPDGSKDVIFFKKIGGIPGEESGEVQVRFSDYRSVSGVQLPYRWTRSLNGAVAETFDVTNYEVNPPNIAEKFQNTHVFVRTKKPDGQ